MDRADGVAYLDARLSAYILAVGRTATDDTANLGPAVDDALRALGTAAADLATAEPEGEPAEEDFRVQLTYRALLQIVRDLGATYFNVATSGDSFSLNQVRVAAEKDLALAEQAVVERFGTTGIVPTGDSGAVWTIDLNFLADPCEATS